MTDWLNNDALFTTECRKGHAWERYVASFLSLQGLHVDVKPQHIRNHVSQRHRYKNTVDLSCEGALIEVKSRHLVFHTPSDFPHPTIFVDTVSGWDAKYPKPDALLCVSQQTGAMICLGTSKTSSQWGVSVKRDHTRGIEDSFYEAPRDLWKPIESLVQVLHRIRIARLQEPSQDVG